MKPLRSLLSLILLQLLATGLAAQTAWRRTNGPFGGQVNAIAVDRAGNRWVAIWGRGVFRQVRENPAGWEELTAGAQVTRIVAMTVDSSAGPGRIYVASGDEVYRLNGGRNGWEPAAPGVTGGAVNALATGADGTVYAGFLNGPTLMLRPDDAAWAPIAPNAPVRANAIYAAPDGTLFIADDIGLLRLRPGTPGVDTLTLGLPEPPMVLQIARHPSSGLHIRTSNRGIFRLDAGDRWRVLDSVTTDSLAATGNIGGMAIDGTGDIYLYMSPVQEFDRGPIYRMRAGDTAWRLADTTLPPVGPMMIAVDRGTLLVGSYAGLFGRGIEETGWNDLNDGIDALGINVLLPLSDGRTLCGAAAGGVFLRESLGSWRHISEGLREGWIGALAADSAGTFYASTTLSLYRMRTGDTAWTRFVEGMAMPFDIRAIAAGDSGELYAPGILRRDSADTLWRPMAMEFNPLGPDGGTAISFARAPDGRLYSGTTIGNVHVLAPGDTAWRLPKFDQLRDRFAGRINALRVERSGRLYARTSTGVYRLEPDSTVWRLMDQGLGAGEARTDQPALALDANDDLYSVARDVIRWDRTAERWKYLGMIDSIPTDETGATTVAFDAGGYLLAGTGAHSVIEMTEPVLAGIHTSRTAPITEVRMEVTPNPAAGLVSARFELPARGRVLLRIVDPLGYEVARRIDEPRESGTYAAAFDVRGLAPGSYFIELRAGDARKVERIVVVR